MKSWKHLPQNPAVAKYIDCYWLIEKTADDISANHPKLNPDPAAHLLIAPPDQAYHYRFGGGDFVGSGSHLILPNTSSIIMDHSQPFVVLGIKFHVGGLYPLAFNNAIPLTYSVITDVNILPLEIRSLSVSELLSDTNIQPEQVCTKLDENLLSWVDRSQEDVHSDLVRRIVSIFDQTPISDIGSTLSCSQRTVERAFRKVSGLTLKQYQSMTLLESLLAYLHQREKNQINWADIAVEFGFSDQPHLIRKLKSTIGATPSDYLKIRDVTIDVYGDFE